MRAKGLHLILKHKFIYYDFVWSSYLQKKKTKLVSYCYKERKTNFKGKNKNKKLL